MQRDGQQPMGRGLRTVVTLVFTLGTLAWLASVWLVYFDTR